MRMAIVKLCLALATVAAVMTLATAPARAQAVRTWVSGVGDDANPCSRTAPCNTFAGAISKTAACGEIDALDPGGFGAVTITKCITINGGGGRAGQAASILASGTNGVIVNATGANDRVVLRNLDIQGAGTGLAGVNFIAGIALTIDNVDIDNFANACVNFQPNIRASLVMTGSMLNNCAGGGIVSSAVTSGVNRLNIQNSTIHRSGVGLTADQNTVAIILDSMIANNTGGGVLANAATAQVSIDRSTVSNNQGFGVQSTSGAIIRMSNTSIAYNNGTGLLSSGGGQILTWSNNWVGGNTTDGTRTGTISPQ